MVVVVPDTDEKMPVEVADPAEESPSVDHEVRAYRTQTTDDALSPHDFCRTLRHIHLSPGALVHLYRLQRSQDLLRSFLRQIIFMSGIRTAQ